MNKAFKVFKSSFFCALFSDEPSYHSTNIWNTFRGCFIFSFKIVSTFRGIILCCILFVSTFKAPLTWPSGISSANFQNSWSMVLALYADFKFLSIVKLTVAHKCHSKTKKPRQNKKPWQSKNHGNTKQWQQNEKFTEK